MRKTEAVQTPGRARVNHRLIPLGLAAALFLGSTCSLFNKPPSAPVISGPSAGIVGVPVEFTATATDPDGDSITYQFAWGDGGGSEWTEFVASGGGATASHVFSVCSTYSITALAADRAGNESDWADARSLEVVGINRDYPDSLYGEISVGRGAWRGVVTPDGGYLYVAHEYQDFVTPIRLSDRTVLPEVHVGPSPFDLAVTPDGEYLYVSCSAGSSMTVVRTSDNAVVANVEVGQQPKGIAMSSDGELVYVAVTGGSRLVVVQTAGNNIVDSIPLRSAPFDVAFHPSGASLYVSLPSRGQIGIVQTASRTLADSLSTGLFSTWLGVTPSGGMLYVSNQTDSGLAVVRTADLEVVAHIPLGDPHLNAVAALPSAEYIAVTTWSGLRYISVQHHVVVDSLPYGADGGIAIRSTGDEVYLPSDRRVYVIGER